MFKKLISYYKPYRKTFFIDLFFSFLDAAITIVLPLILNYIMTTVITFEHDKFINYMFMFGGLILLLFAILFFSNYFIVYYGNTFAAKIERDMRSDLFEHFQKLSVSFYDEQKVGALMGRMTNDLNNMTEFLHRAPEDILIFIVRMSGVFTILFFTSWVIALVTLAIIATVFIVALVFVPKLDKLFMKKREQLSEINSKVEENLSGIRAVKSFTNEDFEISKFEKSNNNFVKAQKRLFKTMGIYVSSGLSLILYLIPVVVTTSMFFISSGQVTMAALVTCMLCLDTLIGPVYSMITVVEEFQDHFVGYKRFIEILDIKPDIVDNPDAIELLNCRGNISFENVTFKYNKAKQPVFKNLNLNIPAGEYVAIVGSSGVGKSTICGLIPRFYDVNKGSVKVDSVDVRDLKIKNLRENVGYVQQQTYLFGGTIMENIKYGKISASDEEVVEAAKRAYAHDFIIKLPDGYNTKLGPRGAGLSGGQAQRIAISRVFLKNPPILIFDEATSALDNESERFIQLSLESLTKGRTTIVIAHRLSTIRNADRILVFDKLGIAEEGTHEELLDMNGIYAGFYSGTKVIK